MSSPEHLGSLDQIWKRVVKEGVKYDLKRKDIIIFLKSFPSHSLRKRVVKKFNRGVFMMRYINYMWEMDLMHMEDYKDYNKGVKYILVVIDSLSRVAYLEPLIRKDTGSCIIALENIINRVKISPKLIFSDKGGEFESKLFLRYCIIYNIRQYFSYTEKHSGKCERLIGKLKNKIYSYFTQSNQLEYVSKLQKFENNYNNTYHSVIKMTPLSVNKKNEYIVFLNSYRNFFIIEFRRLIERYKVQCLDKWGRGRTKSNSIRVTYEKRLKVGTAVRLLKLTNPYHKSYKGNFTDEIFYIREVKKGNPTRYFLKDKKGENILGSVFISELNVVSELTKYYTDKDGNKALIREILKSETKRNGIKKYYCIIQYIGSGVRKNIWIDHNDLTDD